MDPHEFVRIYHPVIGEGGLVPRSSLPEWAKSGWTTEPPKTSEPEEGPAKPTRPAKKAATSPEKE